MIRFLKVILFLTIYSFTSNKLHGDLSSILESAFWDWCRYYYIFDYLETNGRDIMLHLLSYPLPLIKQNKTCFIITYTENDGITLFTLRHAFAKWHYFPCKLDSPTPRLFSFLLVLGKNVCWRFIEEVANWKHGIGF